MTLRQALYILTLFLTGQTLYAQSSQGYIYYDKVVVTLPQYAIGQIIIETRKKQLHDSITTFIDDFKRSLDGPHNVKMDSTGKAELEDRLMKIQNNIENFQHYAEQELSGIQQKIEVILKDIVVSQLKIYCTSKNIACVADHKSVLYCTECIDFTDDFVEYLKTKVE
jgi:Skp family chaperone for outer membrane proteins